MTEVDETAIVTPRKIKWAGLRDKDAVKRLAAFVGCRTTDEWEIYEACQLQRLHGELNKGRQL